jgi:hypothetical protein
MGEEAVPAVGTVAGGSSCYCSARTADVLAGASKTQHTLQCIMHSKQAYT